MYPTGEALSLPYTLEVGRILRSLAGIVVEPVDGTYPASVMERAFVDAKMLNPSEPLVIKPHELVEPSEENPTGLRNFRASRAVYMPNASPNDRPIGSVGRQFNIPPDWTQWYDKLQRFPDTLNAYAEGDVFSGKHRKEGYEATMVILDYRAITYLLPDKGILRRGELKVDSEEPLKPLDVIFELKLDMRTMVEYGTGTGVPEDYFFVSQQVPYYPRNFDALGAEYSCHLPRTSFVIHARNIPLVVQSFLNPERVFNEPRRT